MRFMQKDNDVLRIYMYISSILEYFTAQALYGINTQAVHGDDKITHGIWIYDKDTVIPKPNDRAWEGITVLFYCHGT